MVEPNPAQDSFAVGIDLGTTFSCIGVWKDGRVEIVHNECGNATTPSYVSFFKDQILLVGDSAVTKVGVNPKNTIYDIKRLIGRDFNDPHVQKDIGNWPFKVV